MKRFLTTYRNLKKDLQGGEQKLDDILLYVDFLENKYDLPAILLKDGAVMLLFEITGVDHEKLSAEEREACSRLLRTAFTQMDRGVVVSNFLNRDIRNCHPLKENDNAPEIIRFLQTRKQKFWNGVSADSFSNTIFGSIRYWDPGKKEIPWSSLIRENKLHRFSRKELENHLDKLNQALVTMRSVFAKFGLRIPSRQESFSILYRLVNFGEPPEYRDDLSLNVQLGQSGYEFEQDSMKHSGGTHSQVISVKVPPKYSHSIYLERLFDLNVKFVIRQSFRILALSKMEKRLLSNQNIARSLSSVDKKCENYVAEVDDFMKDVKVNGEVPVKWSLTMMLSSKDRDVLKEKVSEALTIFREIGTAALVERYNLPAAVFGGLPGMEKMNARYSTILTRNAGDFFSVHLLYRGDPDPTDYFIDRARGIFSYTPFTRRENAGHMAITGPTGGGKSFLVNKLLLSGMSEDPRIYVIDLSRSFMELFGFLQEEAPEHTSIMTVSKEAVNFTFNPFLIPDLNEPVPEHQMKFCEGLLRIMIGPNLINEGNRVILSDTLSQFFFQYRSILKSAKGRMDVPPLDILIPILEQKTKNRDIPNALRYWQTGDRGKLFNSGRDSLRASKYVYFDIRDMETSSEEISAVIYSVFNKIFTDITRREHLDVPKFLFLDEAHRYLKNPEFSFWIDLLIRMGRHYNLLVGIITQSINDLVKEEEWSTGILNNIQQGFFFSGQRDIEEAFSKLQMKESHIRLYKNMKSADREVLYWSSRGIRRVLRPLTDPHTYWTATTDPEERQLRAHVKENFYGGDTGKTIDALADLTSEFQGSRSERAAFIRDHFNREAERCSCSG